MGIQSATAGSSSGGNAPNPLVDPARVPQTYTFGPNANPTPTPTPGLLENPLFGEKNAESAAGNLNSIGAGGSVAGVQGAFGGPGQGQQYWSGVQGAFSGGGPMVADNAQGAYDTYMKNMPGISPDANLGGYYGDARNRFTQDTNRQLGARGAFNSSAALDKISQGSAKLNAEQANAEAKYGIDRASALGNLYSIGGTLAHGADTSSAAQAESSRKWYETGGVLATAAGTEKTTQDRIKLDAAIADDKIKIDAYVASATAGLAGQEATVDRIQKTYDNIMQMGGQVAQLVSSAYRDIIEGDEAAMAAALSGDVAYFTEKYHISEADAARFMGDFKSAAEVFEAIAEKGAK